MRKYFLLILFITGLASLQPGLSARLPLAALKVPAGKVIPEKINATDTACRVDRSAENNFYVSDFDLEDDDHARSKPVQVASPYWLQAGVRFLIQTDQLKYRSSFSRVFSFDLFKWIRVFRL